MKEYILFVKNILCFNFFFILIDKNKNPFYNNVTYLINRKKLFYLFIIKKNLICNNFTMFKESQTNYTMHQEEDKILQQT